MISSCNRCGSAFWPAIACSVDTDRKSTRLDSSHLVISYAVFCLKKKKYNIHRIYLPEEIEYDPKRTNCLLRCPHQRSKQQLLHLSSLDSHTLRLQLAFLTAIDI